MSWTWTPAAVWLARTALGGCGLLLLVWLLALATGQPVRRQRLAEFGLAAALLLAVLSLGPAWFSIPLPWLQPATQPQASTSEPSDPPEDAGIVFHAGVQPGGLSVDPESEPTAQGGDPVPDAVLAVSTDERASSAPVLSLAPSARWLSALYFAGALLVLGRWLLGQVALWRFLRTAVAAPEPVARLFADMTGGEAPRPRLLVSRQLRVPVSCGLLRPAVVLPAQLCEPAHLRTLRWVFAHELTHLRRRDTWSCLLFGLGGAVYFYCPWFWWLGRQVRLCREYVADAAAVRFARAEDYAQFLLGLATAPAGPVTAIGVLGNSSDLFRRVTMLLHAPMRVEKQCPRLWSLGTAAGLMAIAVLTSGLGVRAADSNSASPDRPAAGAADQQPGQKVEPGQGAPKNRVPDDYQRRFEDFKKALEKLDLKQLQPDGRFDERLQELMKNVREMENMLHDLPVQQELERLYRDGVLPNMARFGGSGSGGFSGFGFRVSSEGRLGITAERPSPALVDQLDLPKNQGLVISQVSPNSAAAKAGLKPNDILLELDGKKINSNDTSALRKIVREIKADAPVEAVVLRKGKKETITGLSLPEAPAEPRPGFGGRLGAPPGGAGATVAPLPPRNLGLPAGAAIGAPGAPGIPMFGGVGNNFGGVGNNAVMTSVFRTNDRFTTRHQEGNLVITVTGTVTDGKAKTTEIHIQDGQETTKAASLDKVPERYRDKVKNLVEMSEKGNVKIEIHNPGGIRGPAGGGRFPGEFFDQNIK
jgi:beta-lactamase regulating signal transducer with metallopeptidase domain